MHTPRPYTCTPNTRWLRPGAMEAAVLTSRMLAAGLLLAKTKQPECVIPPKSQTEPREAKTRVKAKASPRLSGI